MKDRDFILSLEKAILCALVSKKLLTEEECKLVEEKFLKKGDSYWNVKRS